MIKKQYVSLRPQVILGIDDLNVGMYDTHNIRPVILGSDFEVIIIRERAYFFQTGYLVRDTLDDKRGYWIPKPQFENNFAPMDTLRGRENDTAN